MSQKLRKEAFHEERQKGNFVTYCAAKGSLIPM